MSDAPSSPDDGADGAAPTLSEEPLPEALAELLRRRGLTLAGVGSLLRAEGLTISRTRLHQLASGQGAAPTAEQMERLASVLGVSPGYFAEYRLWRIRALLDPATVGFDRAMANFERLSGRRDLRDQRGTAVRQGTATRRTESA
jgi:transcriptional regulator with XRE-family HTH domain